MIEKAGTSSGATLTRGFLHNDVTPGVVGVGQGGRYDMHTYLFIVILILQVLDVGTTLVALRHGAVEVNPIVNSMIKRLGAKVALLLIKLAFIILLFWFLHYLPIWSLWAVIAVYVGVVIWNIRTIRIQKRV